MITETKAQAKKRIVDQMNLDEDHKLLFWELYDLKKCDCRQDCKEWLLVKVEINLPCMQEV